MTEALQPGVDPDEYAARVRELHRTDALIKAKAAATWWLDRGDPSGCLVKFVVETRKPWFSSEGAPLIDWTRPGMVTLLELGKLYLAPIAAAAELDPFARLCAMSEARENMRRWVEGFR